MPDSACPEGQLMTQPAVEIVADLDENHGPLAICLFVHGGGIFFDP
jgi:hypothetical protein